MEETKMILRGIDNYSGAWCKGLIESRRQKILVTIFLHFNFIRKPVSKTIVLLYGFHLPNIFWKKLYSQVPIKQVGPSKQVG